MMIYIICIVIAAAVVLADYFTKAMVVERIPLGESVDVIEGVFRFTHIRNEGAAFGMLSNSRWVFLSLSTVAIIAIIAYVAWKRPKNELLLVSLSLIVGGGIGNMIDRVKLGYVVDFLDFCAFPSLWKWIFNVADAAACIGAGMLFLYLIIDLIQTSKKEKAEKAAKAADSAEILDAEPAAEAGTAEASAPEQTQENGSVGETAPEEVQEADIPDDIPQETAPEPQAAEPDAASEKKEDAE